MHIYFKRSGGFMGVPLTADLDTASLPTEEAEAIEQVLAEAHFFDLPSEPAQIEGADRFTYEITVVSEATEHTIYFSEQNTPLEINSLVRQLTILARRPPDQASGEGT